MYAQLILISIIACCACCEVVENKRSIYVIGHMVNSIEDVKEFLDMGSNVLESDITFHRNGSVKEIFHGAPCDCLRVCGKRDKLADYLDHVRQITDPREENNYYKQLILQFFDLKTDNIEQDSKERAGQEMADHVLDNLWANEKHRNPLKVLLFIYKIIDKPVLSGFINRFKQLGVEDMLANVGFDGGMECSKDIKDMLETLGITGHVWQGDGTMNCHSTLYPDTRLKEELQIRDTPNGYIDKVYHWNIDADVQMRTSLKAGVDGLITNRPDILIGVLNEEEFAHLRLATVDDDPFEKFHTQILEIHDTLIL